MASAPIIILIIVVWLFVLAPWILRSQKPVSRTSEGFEATRVVFSGDSGDLVPARRPRPARIARPAASGVSGASANGVGAAQAAHQDAPLADAAVVEPELVAAEELAPDAVRARAAERAAAQAAENVDTVEGEVIAEDDAAELNEQPLADEKSDADEAHDDILDEDALVEDEDDTNADDKHGLVLASDSAEVFTSPVKVERAEDAYVCDEAYISPVDLFYPGAIDSPAEESAEADAAEAADTDDAATQDSADDAVLEDDAAAESADSTVSAESTESAAERADAAPAVQDSDNLSPEELAFAQRRLGRGGWDPEAEQRVRISRRQRRQRVLLTLVVVSVAAVALGIVVGGWGWAPAAVAGSLTALYLVALRNQTRAEQELRRRRIAQLRRARLGVRNAQDEELDIPRRLRHPGAIVLEADDDSPDFHFLPLHYSDVDEDGDGVQIINRRPFEDELQARRVG